MRRTFLRGVMHALALAGIAAVAPTALAADYPERVVRLVVPQGPGGGTDLVARLIAQRLATPLGQAVIVENKPGGGTQLGTEFVAAAPADGHTVLLTASPVVLLPYLRKTRFDFLRDFVPIGQVGVGNFALVVNPKLPFRTAPEFLAAVRANPGKYTFGSAGVGSAGHLALELLKARAGLEMVHVPYKSSGEVAQGVASGQIDSSIDNLTTQKVQIAAQTVRGLATTGLARDPGLPELPTLQELNLIPGGYTMTYWYGMFVPTRTPAPVVARLRSEFAAMMAEPKMQEQIRGMSLVPSAFKAEEFGTHLAAEAAMWKGIISAARIEMP